MQLTKYKLGDLIAQRREKNQNYDVPIRGVSREGFINAKQQEADTSIYNVFYKKDFVFNPARMELNSIALNLEYDKALCSSLYEVFYVKDESIVLPEFLNLHIKREEFARHCEYIGSGSAREYCRFAHISEFNIELPPLNVQEEIVKADRLIKRKIALNNRLIKALEDTAQAIYHHTFVENIDPENLPEGWKWGKLSDIANINMGQSPEGESLNTIGDGDIFYQGRTDFGVRFPDIRVYTTEAKKYAASYDILISVRAPVGDLNITRNKCAIGRGIAAITPKIGSSFVFYTLQNQAAQFKKSNDEGTIFGSIGKEDLFELKVLVPEDKVVNEFNSNLEDIDKFIDTADMENSKMLKVKDLLLAKLS